MIDIILSVLDIMGYISTVVVLVAGVIGLAAWIKGILPALMRLGNGLAIRKIVVFAKSDEFSSLRSLLIDSGLIAKGNITHISTKDDFGKAEKSTLFLVYWPDWKDEIVEIKNLKTDGDSLVVYAPYAEGKIPDETMAELNQGRNVSVVNFRGRLLNDIVTAMITTGYIKQT